MRRFLLYALVALGLLLVLLMVAPLLVPTESILRATEAVASHAAGMPVKIKRLSLRALPQPMVLVDGFTIGDAKGGAFRVIVASGRASLALKPLFYGRMEVTGIRLRDVTLSVPKQASDKHVRIVHIDMLRGLIKPKREERRHSYWSARMYGGTVSMDVMIFTPKSVQQRVLAKLKMDNIQVQPLIADVAGIEKVSGVLSSTLDIEATGAEAKTMLTSLKIDGPIHMTGVSIANVDASHVLKDEKSGQVTLHLKQKPTEFKFLNMALHMQGRDASLDDIELYSSRLEATGKITVKNGSQLEGKIVPSGLAGLVGITMLVSGTLEHPEIHPAPPSLKGATVEGAAASKSEDRK